MKKRKLRKWVRVTLAIGKVALQLCICCFLALAVMDAWSDAHYQQLERYGEVAVND